MCNHPLPEEHGSADPAAARLTLRLFGSFEARVGDAPLCRLRTRKAQWLLALLALRPGAELERAWLAGVLWPDSSQTAALANLRSVLMDLRHALGAAADCLRCPTTRTLCLDPAGAEIDVREFDAAIARRDAASLQQAVARYRGPLLEDCGEEWVFAERQSREQAYLEALEALAAQALRNRDHAAAERCLRRAVAVDPLRESAQRALMQVLAAGGNYAAALLIYRELRSRLHREMNAEPDPETTALVKQIRAEAQQRALLTAPSGTPPGAGSAPTLAHGPVAPEGTVTFLFTDIEGSTELWERQPEAMRAALDRHNALLRHSIERERGSVFKTVGDAFHAVFSTAPAALAAALSGQQALQTEDWGETGPLRVRMALHTGTADEQEGDYFGPTLSRIARLLEAAHGGQVLLSAATQELVRDQLLEGTSLRDLGEHRLRDLTRPERIFQLLHPDLEREFPPLRTLDARRHNLPLQRTLLLGREKEVAAVRDLLRRDEVGLVTLTGPGGTGKTRLGLQVAADLLEEFRDGAFFVDLAPISDPALVAATIAQVLGVREAEGLPLTESLKGYLQPRQVLLLLDNFEQVVAAAPVVAELLTAAPQLKVLVTSRAALHLRGEKEFPVPPLALPDRKRLPSAEHLSQYAAVELFIQRAQDVQPEFAVTNENAPAVAEICHRLDGLPLAIELAVGRLKLFPPQVLLSRLEARLPLLTGGARDLPTRQQMLRSAIAWSYDLLEEPQQQLFRRLCVFVGGFSLAAAEEVCNRQRALGIDVLDGIAALIDQNLLRQEAGPDPGTEDEIRFGMLETIREFGQECLAQSAEAETIRCQHAQFFLALAERERDRPGRLKGERDNLRTALGWVLEAEEAALGFRFAEALRPFWFEYGLTEGREYLGRLLALLQPRSHLHARAHTLHSAGRLAFQQGDFGAAREFFEESLAICQELGEREQVSWRHDDLGVVALNQGDYERARAHYEQGHTIAHELGHQELIALTLNGLGKIEQARGDLPQAAALFQQTLAIVREPDWRGASHAKIFMPIVLANVIIAQGDQIMARALLDEARVVGRKEGDRIRRSSMCIDQGHALLSLGDYAVARSRFEEGLALRRAEKATGHIAWALLEAGHAAWLQGEPEVTESHAVEALQLFQQPEKELLTKSGILAALESLAVAALAQGPPGTGPSPLPSWGARPTSWVPPAPAPPARAAGPERAARLMGAAGALREGMRLPVPEFWLRPRERIGEAVRAASLEQAFAAAWAEGRAMTLEQAIEYALQEDELP